MNELQIAYVLDIAVSAPIVLLPFLGDTVGSRWILGDALPESMSFRRLLGALWLALLGCLIAGVFFPIVMAPILVLQLAYKSLWLTLYALPHVLAGRHDEVPWKLAAIFIAFVVVFPWVIPWEAMFAPR